MENQKEGMTFKDAVKAEVKRSNEKKYDFGEIEKKIDVMDKMINAPIGEGDKDQEEPLTVGRKIDRNLIRPERRSIRYPLTTEEKIKLMGLLFPIALGDEVKNKFDEVGYVESVSIDHRGVLYLVRYKTHEILWESEYQIEKISLHLSNGGDLHRKTEGKSIKTDVPDPKMVKRGDRESELE